MRRAYIRSKKEFLYVFLTIFSASSGPVPLTFPCYFRQCVQAQIQLDTYWGSGQPVRVSISFLYTTLFRQHHTNHFPDHSHNHICSYVLPPPRKIANISLC